MSRLVPATPLHEIPQPRGFVERRAPSGKKWHRTPCRVCGGPKEAGQGRRICEACLAPDLREGRNQLSRDQTRRARHLWHRYRLRLEDYDRLVATQRGLCAICRRKPNGLLHVDHDHATGKVRALLCMRCNNLVGILESDFAATARAYLEGHRA